MLILLGVAVAGPARWRLALGLRLGGIRFKLFSLLRQFFRVGLVGLVSPIRGVETVEHRLQFRIRGQRLAPDPRLRRACAIRQREDAHRHLDLALQIAGKDITDGGKTRHRRGAAYQPFTPDARLRCISFARLAGKHADQRIIRGRNLLFLVGNPREILYFFRDGKIHVGLAGGQPHLAHQDVAQFLIFDFGFSIDRTDGEIARFSTGFERIEGQAPLAVGAGGRGLFLAGEFDRDPLAGVGDAPDGHLHFTLEDHVVGERACEFHLGEQRRDEREREQEQSDGFFHG